MFLIPSMLPNERPTLDQHLEKYITIELENDDKHYCLKRTYHMSYIPAGFWSRLIGECLFAKKKKNIELYPYLFCYPQINNLSDNVKKKINE